VVAAGAQCAGSRGRDAHPTGWKASWSLGLLSASTAQVTHEKVRDEGVTASWQ